MGSEPAVGRAAALSVNGLTVRFGGRLALDGVDLAAAPAELLGLVGANGAGKSTLLDAVSGFIVPSAGGISIDGRDLGRRSPAARAREGLGRVMQDARLFDDLTVEEAVLLGADAGGTSAAGRASRAAAAIELLGLEAWAETPCQQLSTGSRRRAELACAIAGRPRLLLLDEPTAGLGAAEAEGMGPLISRLRDEVGLTVVLVEHDVPLVLSVADRVVCLGAGRVIADGPPGEVIRNAEVVASFLGGDPDTVAGG